MGCGVRNIGFLSFRDWQNTRLEQACDVKSRGTDAIVIDTTCNTNRAFELSRATPGIYLDEAHTQKGVELDVIR